jgi:hypothetical protein
MSHGTTVMVVTMSQGGWPYELHKIPFMEAAGRNLLQFAKTNFKSQGGLLVSGGAVSKNLQALLFV